MTLRRRQQTGNTNDDVAEVLERLTRRIAQLERELARLRRNQ